MTNYYIEKDNKIIFFDIDLQRLQNTVMGQDLEIKETERPIENFEFADTPEYLAQQLGAKRAEKLVECTSKAYNFIQNKALFEISETQHIEATDGNIGKFSAFMAGFSGGLIESVPWSTYENENITLNFGEAMTVLQGLLEAQAHVWTVKHNGYVEAIKSADTIEELNAIVIDYEG